MNKEDKMLFPESRKIVDAIKSIPNFRKDHFVTTMMLPLYANRKVEVPVAEYFQPFVNTYNKVRDDYTEKYNSLFNKASEKEKMYMAYDAVVGQKEVDEHSEGVEKHVDEYNQTFREFIMRKEALQYIVSVVDEEC